MRMIAKWSKTGNAIFSSHLDIQRAFQMWFSRANIPIKYSQGFNPHPVLSFATALSLGVESHAEYADIAMSEEMEPSAFITRMKEHAPPGLAITNSMRVEDSFPSLMGTLKRAVYDIDLKDWEIRQDSCIQAAKRIMESAVYEAVRRTKSGEKTEDIRPMILSLNISDSTIHATLACSSQATLAPQVLAEVITKEAHANCNGANGTECKHQECKHQGCMHIIRRELLFASDNKIVPLL